jgi:hypothetical protein
MDGAVLGVSVVGVLVGVWEGKLDSTNMVGEPDGEPLGAKVGATLGAMLGEPLGTTVGAMLEQCWESH